jgi:hypothetical protein
VTTDATKAAKLLGSKGGRATASKMTNAQLAARATKASKTRWAKRDAARYPGEDVPVSTPKTRYPGEGK